MKRYLTLAVLLASLNVALGFEVNGLYYAVEPDDPTKVYVCKSRDYSGDIEIPSSIVYGGKKYIVDRIAEEAFASTTITSIKIPNTISVIDSKTFTYCKHLWKVDFSNSVTEIKSSAFEFSGAQQLINYDGLKIIGDFAFRSCESLSSVYIPESVEYIGGGAFCGCERLSKAIIGDSNKTLEISGYAKVFFYCPLESVHIGRKVKIRGSQNEYYNIFKESAECIETLSIGSSSSFMQNNEGQFDGFGESIKRIFVLSATPPNMAATTFRNKQNCKVYVPRGALPRYEVAKGWQEFYNIIETTPFNDDIKSRQNIVSLERTYAFMWEDYYKSFPPQK